MSSISSNASSSVLANLLKDYQAAKASASAVTSGASSSVAAAVPASGGDDAYILDLSQAAQDILSGRSAPGTVSLSELQKQKLDSVLEKYKDAPVNDETLTALNADLQQAGLSPEGLAALEQAKGYNALTSLLNILFGDGKDAAGSADEVLSGLGTASEGYANSARSLGAVLQESESDTYA
jgi:hypothetical protein